MGFDRRRTCRRESSASLQNQAPLGNRWESDNRRNGCRTGLKPVCHVEQMALDSEQEPPGALVQTAGYAIGSRDVLRCLARCRHDEMVLTGPSVQPNFIDSWVKCQPC